MLAHERLEQPVARDGRRVPRREVALDRRIGRFGGGSASSTAAVATAVVSKPVAKKITGSRLARASSVACVAA
jgi:hypothetical protein